MAVGLFRPLLPALTLALGLVSAARADWPHLRGPNYDAVSAEIGLADSWPADGPPLMWRRELGQGHSGFIVAQGKVYTQRQTLSGQSLLCLDPENGQTIWETRYDWPWQPRGAYPGPYATPTWYRGKVYYASPSGLVGCLDADTGKSLWTVKLREKFEGKGYGFGCAATPLVEDDRVILPAGGPAAGLVALHADDGRTLWTSGSDPASYCPAFPITFQGRRAVVGYLENALVLVEAATGKQLYRQPLSTGYDEHSAWPLYREPHLFLAAPFRAAAVCLELQEGPASWLCRPRWTNRELCNDIVSSVLYREHIYGFDLKQAQASKHRPSRGTFKCLDWSTGKLRWSTEQVGHASVLEADDKLLLFNDQGEALLAAADPAAYRELGRIQVFNDEICWTPPTLWNGHLLVRSPSQAACFYVGRASKEPKLAPAPPAWSWRIDERWLFSREREYPNDAFSRREMNLWFAACVVMLGASAVLTGLLLFLARRSGRQLSGTPIFWGLVFILGVLGPGLFSTWLDRCLFTWPLAVYVSLHVTVLACSWAEQQPLKRRPRWLARLAMAGLVIVSYGYFELCKAVGMFVAWSFLFGILPAFPLAYLAARATVKRRPLWLVGLRTLLAFTVFFWSCDVLLWWKEIDS